MKLRMATVVDPRIMAGKRAMSGTRNDYVVVPTIHTRGSWPIVHMIDEDTFVQMAILAEHVTPDARKRYAHSRGKS